MLNSFLARYLLDMRVDGAGVLIQQAAAAGRVDSDIIGQWRKDEQIVRQKGTRP